MPSSCEIRERRVKALSHARSSQHKDKFGTSASSGISGMLGPPDTWRSGMFGPPETWREGPPGTSRPKFAADEALGFRVRRGAWDAGSQHEPP